MPDDPRQTTRRVIRHRIQSSAHDTSRSQARPAGSSPARLWQRARRAMVGGGLAAVLALGMGAVWSQPAVAQDAPAGPAAPASQPAGVSPSVDVTGGRVSFQIRPGVVGVAGVRSDDQNTAFTGGIGVGQAGRASTGDINQPPAPGIYGGIMARTSWDLGWDRGTSSPTIRGPGFPDGPRSPLSVGLAFDANTSGQVSARVGVSYAIGSWSGQWAFEVNRDPATGEWSTESPIFGRYSWGSERFVALTGTLSVPNSVLQDLANRAWNLLPESVRNVIDPVESVEEIQPAAPAETQPEGLGTGTEGTTPAPETGTEGTTPAPETGTEGATPAPETGTEGATPAPETGTEDTGTDETGFVEGLTPTPETGTEGTGLDEGLAPAPEATTEEADTEDAGTEGATSVPETGTEGVTPAPEADIDTGFDSGVFDDTVDDGGITGFDSGIDAGFDSGAFDGTVYDNGAGAFDGTVYDNGAGGFDGTVYDNSSFDGSSTDGGVLDGTVYDSGTESFDESLGIGGYDDSGIGTDFDSGYDSGFDSGYDSGFDSGFDSGGGYDSGGGFGGDGGGY